MSFPLQTVKGTSRTRGFPKGVSDRFENRQSQQPYPEHVPPGLREVKRERVSPSVRYRAGAANSERRDKCSSLSPPRRPGQAALPSCPQRMTPRRGTTFSEPWSTLPPSGKYWAQQWCQENRPTRWLHSGPGEMLPPPLPPQKCARFRSKGTDRPNGSCEFRRCFSSWFSRQSPRRH